MQLSYHGGGSAARTSSATADARAMGAAPLRYMTPRLQDRSYTFLPISCSLPLFHARQTSSSLSQACMHLRAVCRIFSVDHRSSSLRPTLPPSLCRRIPLNAALSNRCARYENPAGRPAGGDGACAHVYVYISANATFDTSPSSSLKTLLLAFLTLPRSSFSSHSPGDLCEVHGSQVECLPESSEDPATAAFVRSIRDRLSSPGGKQTGGWHTYTTH